MGALIRSSYGRGWIPDADPLNGPRDGLLRMDNGILDELGAVSLRPGSAKINSVALADTDCHSLYTAVLGGTRYRMTGAAAAVYANGSSISTGLAGSNDIAFGTGYGQILFARSTSKKKYDGTSVRNWGVSMTGGTPTVAAVTADKKVFASGASTETWTMDSDDGTGEVHGSGYDNTANAAISLNPNTSTGLGLTRRTLASDTTFATLDGGSTATDDSIIAVWFFATTPSSVKRITLEIAVNSSSGNLFTTDRYVYEWLNAAWGEYQLTPSGERPANVVDLNLDPGGSGVADGWIRLTARRGDLIHPAAFTAGKDWSTVRAVRLGVLCAGGGASNLVKFQDLRISGGSAGAITGANKLWKYVYVRNNGSGVAYGFSAPSAASAGTALEAQGATITAPADASRDSQINEIWLYRFIDDAGEYYRVKVKTGVSGTASVDIDDNGITDADALTTNVPILGVTGTAQTPPDNIIGIAGPYFDRLFTLTSDGLVGVSQQVSVDTFLAERQIRLTGVDETPYWILKGLGGVYLGTSKDIYVLDGDGAEYPDGSINFTLKALNIDNPPIMQSAVAQEGNSLVYLANDGWRAMQGAGSESLSGATSLLYRGYTRHGVSAVNLVTGRLRAALVKGQLIAITPEGASTTSSSVLYRRNFGPQTWYRHTYGSQAWRAIHREPDGTLIASDSAGFVWVLDSGTQDGSSNIAVTLWTTVDDDGVAFARKDPQSLRVLADTGNVACSVAIHLDSSGSAASTKTVTHNGMTTTAFDISDVAAFKAVQYRITVTTAAFRWEHSLLGYNTLPTAIIGRVPETNAGYVGEKVLTGLMIRACTLAAARTFTPYFDGVAGSTFQITSATDEPDTYIYQLPTTTKTATDISFAVDGSIELYEWEPLVLYQLPVRVKVWENKPLVRSVTRRRFGGFNIQANTQGVAATITPVVDGVDQTTLTLTTSDLLASVLTFDADVGRDLWCRITSSTAFTPLAVDPIVLETLPQQMKGLTPSSAFGQAGIKTVSGIQIRLCTLAAAVTVTPVLDGVEQTASALSITTGADAPEDHTIRFAAAAEATEIALTFSGNVEVYSWQPLVSHVRPLGVLAWDSGPIDLGSQDLVWLREVRLKIRAGGELTITPYFDGRAFTAITTDGVATGVDTVVPIPVGRQYVGRQPRLVVTSDSPFYPYWIECTRRTTGRGSQKPVVRVPVKLGAVA